MSKEIVSDYIRFHGQELPPWNARYFKEGGNVLVPQPNSTTMEYLGKLKNAIEREDIRVNKRTVCYCGDDELELLSDFDRFGLAFKTLICKGCGLVMTSPFIEETSLAKYYETYYHPIHFGIVDFKNRREVLFNVGQGVKIFQKTKKNLNTSSHIKVLEIGVGTGSVLREFKDAAKASGLEVEELGTEFNEYCIEKAKQNGIKVIKGSFDEVIERNEKFDLVIMSHVFEHFLDLKKETAKLKLVLKDTGIAYIEVPGIMTLQKKEEYSFDYLRYTTHAHIYNFNLASLTWVLNDSGFRLISGNEEVEAIYMLGKQSVDVSDNYYELINYLTFLERNDPDRLNRADLVKELKPLQQEIINIKQSLSWKLTAPLRCIVKPFWFKK